jgi:hypothetical protein
MLVWVPIHMYMYIHLLHPFQCLNIGVHIDCTLMQSTGTCTTCTLYTYTSYSPQYSSRAVFHHHRLSKVDHQPQVSSLGPLEQAAREKYII